MTTKTITLLALTIALLSGCNKSSTSADIEETGQQIGDVMASIDESGGSTGTLAYNDKVFERHSPASLWDKTYDVVIPTAFAAACASSSTFGSCSSTTMVRTFGGCTVGGATLEGVVTLTWGGAATTCLLTTAGDTLTRVPAFSLTGRRGAVLTVTKTGSVGQRLTWSSGSGTSRVFSFTNDGIRRVFTLGSETLFDFTTQTTSAITVTGTTRASRVMSGGTLRVTNNLNSVTCDYSPTDVTWASTCNCAVSGTWSGTCSDGKTTSLSLTGCGTGTLTVGSESQAFSFDRCASL